MWQGASTVASLTWNNIAVPTAQFLKPAAVFVWENAIRPVAELIAPALKFVWDNVVVKGFELLFWGIGKVFEGTMRVLGFLYQNAWVPVSQFIRGGSGAIGNALAPAAD